MNHETNDFLSADVYKNLSNSLAGSLSSILGSRKNSIIVEGIFCLFNEKRRVNHCILFLTPFLLEISLIHQKCHLDTRLHIGCQSNEEKIVLIYIENQYF